MGGCGCLASTNVLEDRGDDIGIFDAGDDAQFAAALGAGLDVDGEDAFRAPHPGHGGKGLIRLALANTSRVEDVEVDQLVVITHRNALQGQDRRNTAFFGRLRYAMMGLNRLRLGSMVFHTAV